ncbi:unnamed protein product [Owenia fusiformis]|uniref:Uncharacterized protein n=1 Tax=Owenia fusiformis TaxID=6347 RepID=A0A8J1UU27_OWEFU|nr:unnamed protein product [Owenia fusiformis]
MVPSDAFLYIYSICVYIHKCYGLYVPAEAAGQQTFEDAQRYCETAHDGHIAMPKNSLEATFLHISALGKSWSTYWIGLKKPDVVSPWPLALEGLVDINGCNISYIHQDADENTWDPSKVCVVSESSESWGSIWVEEDCNSTKHFICDTTPDDSCSQATTTEVTTTDEQSTTDGQTTTPEQTTTAEVTTTFEVMTTVGQSTTAEQTTTHEQTTRAEVTTTVEVMTTADKTTTTDAVTTTPELRITSEETTIEETTTEVTTIDQVSTTAEVTTSAELTTSELEALSPVIIKLQQQGQEPAKWPIKKYVYPPSEAGRAIPIGILSLLLIAGVILAVIVSDLAILKDHFERFMLRNIFSHCNVKRVWSKYTKCQK